MICALYDVYMYIYKVNKDYYYYCYVISHDSETTTLPCDSMIELPCYALTETSTNYIYFIGIYVSKYQQNNFQYTRYNI